MLALQWIDKRPVAMLFTVHTSGLQQTKTKVVLEHNNVNGVDLSDQLAQ